MIDNDRKIIIDCDPGIDDAVALCAAFAISHLDILAVTAVEGCATAEKVTANVEGLIEKLDPARLPRTGAASPSSDPIAVDTRYLHGDDGLGDVDLDAPTLLNRVPSEKLMADLIRQHPGDISIYCLGPLTNIARLLQLEPTVATMIDQLYIVGGAVDGIGSITPSAEFNMFFDPVSAREVFHSAITKTLIPLDLTRRVDFGFEFFQELSDSKCPAFLKESVHHLYQNYRQQLGQESIELHDAVGLIAALNPKWLETEELSGDVETVGEITRGVTVFDRRMHRDFRPNISVGLEFDSLRVKEELTRLICRK